MPCDGLQPISGHEARPIPDPKACRIGARELKRRQALVDADTGRARQLGQQRDQDAAAPRAEVEEPQRRLAADERQRSLDQRLGIRAGVERARIDAERAPVELANPDDARHRLAGEPPRHVSPEPRRGVGRERIVEPGDIGFVGQACRVAEQEPRIELWRRDPCLAQQPRRRQEASLIVLEPGRLLSPPSLYFASSCPAFEPGIQGSGPGASGPGFGAAMRGAVRADLAAPGLRTPRYRLRPLEEWSGGQVGPLRQLTHGPLPGRRRAGSSDAR